MILGAPCQWQEVGDRVACVTPRAELFLPLVLACIPLVAVLAITVWGAVSIPARAKICSPVHLGFHYFMVSKNAGLILWVVVGAMVATLELWYDVRSGILSLFFGLILAYFYFVAVRNARHRKAEVRR